MGALTVCDDLLDAGQRIRALEEAAENPARDVRVAAVESRQATQTAGSRTR